MNERGGSSAKSPAIIDGGGHIGMAALYFKHIHPKSKIMIFEPDPEALSLLRKNIKTNDLKNIIIYPLGLSDQETEEYLENSGTDGAKIGNSNLGNKIKTVKLSYYINSEIDFLKLNIEGAELKVIKDLELNNKLNNISEMVIEWHSFVGQSQNLGELLTILERNNFKYLINHHDYGINKVLRPPFSLKDKARYYLLIYAKKI
ncbi:MAG: FkbM family methyltransferase [Patescibacteria group bacterium]